MFTQARIKLTAYYVLIIIVIITLFSVILLNYTSQHVRDTIDEDVPTRDIQRVVVENTIRQLETSLLFGDAVIILIAGLLSYWLAGITLKPIQAALSAQEQFSANASHELRTPLSVMRTENEVFQKNKHPSSEEINNLAKSNLEEIKRMSAMVENLLMLARSKESTAPIEQTSVNLSSIIERCVNKLQGFAASKNISMKIEKTSDAFVFGNEKLFEHLFFNLIQNAITYTKEGSVTVKISQNDVVTVQVIDTGIGISKKDLDHIFEPFYKADTSRTISSSGVGLGLSIVREIVQRFKGSLKIESEVDKGTLVNVTFPSSSEKTSS